LRLENSKNLRLMDYRSTNIDHAIEIHNCDAIVLYTPQNFSSVIVRDSIDINFDISHVDGFYARQDPVILSNILVK
jgi:hypothetical protein